MSMMDPCSWQRLAYRLSKAHVPVIPRCMDYLVRLVFTAWIPHSAEIGEGTRSNYGGMGVVIHSHAKIGRNVEIGQHVTIGGNHRDRGVPVIEDDVCISCGAKILGPIRVGRGSVIAANAVVIRDVPPYCVVGGVPARILRENIDPKEFLFHRRNNPKYKPRQNTPGKD